MELFWMLALIFACVETRVIDNGDGTSIIEVIAPELRVNPSDTEDLHLCYRVQVPEGDTVWATAFVPTPGAFVAHHMKLYSCVPEYTQETIWACGPEPFNVTQYKDGTTCVAEEQIIYVWAKNATRLDLPKGVGFKLKGGSHLLLGLHYKGTPNTPKQVVPGINVVVTKKKQPKLGRVFMMHSSKNDIAPHTTEFWDMECPVREGTKPFHPFAFRTHAHNLGRAILGYKIDGRTHEWLMIGSMDPLLPQAFYPVQTKSEMVIRPGDMLAARCIMVNDQDKVIYSGPTDSDEMCVYYIMYWIDDDDGEEITENQILPKCKSKSKKGRWENWFTNVPEDADTYNGIKYRETDPLKYKKKGEDDKMILKINAPELKVDPKRVEDIQLCYVVQVPEGNASYAIGFEPTEGAMIVAHHMRLFTCAPGSRQADVWVCGPEGNPFPEAYPWGPPCMTEEKTIYVWAKNASKLELPDDVGFHLPGGSHIVLALHYKDVGHIPKEIVPGINVVLTKEVPGKLAGVFQIINDYNEIKPNTTEFWDTECQVEDGKLPFFPFAFRVHAHHLGRAIMGYKIDGETNVWTKIGVMDPMKPHAFYPVQTDGYIPILPGDKLAARCIMVNDQNKTIPTGPTDYDEMCIFYIMYYVETDHQPTSEQVMSECMSLGKAGRWSDWFEQTPEEAKTYEGITYKETRSVSSVIEVTAPPLRVAPEATQDLHLCVTVQVPSDEDTLYAVGFEPTPGAIVAHHMKLFSCVPGVRTDTVWGCGPDGFSPQEYEFGLPCMDSEKMLYVWAKNASRLDLPDDVGFYLKGGSHLVLALHYKGLSNLPPTVTPGVKVIVSEQRPTKMAGVFMMVNSYNSILPHTTEFWDVGCEVPDSTYPFYPFAYRTHSHHLGRGIMGYKVDGATQEWTLIGKNDPMLPQAFYPSPMNGSVAVYPGDKLAARCLMVNDRDVEAMTGPTDMHEMCIFYIMYFIDTMKVQSPRASRQMHDCSSAGKMGRWNNWFENIPEGTDEYGGIVYKESVAKKSIGYSGAADGLKKKKLFMKK